MAAKLMLIAAKAHGPSDLRRAAPMTAGRAAII
jgi:hypothetical protein